MVNRPDSINYERPRPVDNAAGGAWSHMMGFTALAIAAAALCEARRHFVSNVACALVVDLPQRKGEWAGTLELLRSREIKFEITSLPALLQIHQFLVIPGN